MRCHGQAADACDLSVSELEWETFEAYKDKADARDGIVLLPQPAAPERLKLILSTAAGVWNCSAAERPASADAPAAQPTQQAGRPQGDGVLPSKISLHCHELNTGPPNESRCILTAGRHTAHGPQAGLMCQHVPKLSLCKNCAECCQDRRCILFIGLSFELYLYQARDEKAPGCPGL